MEPFCFHFFEWDQRRVPTTYHVPVSRLPQSPWNNFVSQKQMHKTYCVQSRGGISKENSEKDVGAEEEASM
jgi:hypothetical protein